MKTLENASVQMLSLTRDYPANEQIKESYKQMLIKIANGFGFNNRLAQSLVNDTAAYAVKHFEIEGKNFSFKIWLAKLMVKNCIRIISESICEQTVSCNNGLSFSSRAVYVLKKDIGFNDKEIALLLNTTLLVIQMRWQKASLFFNCH